MTFCLCPGPCVNFHVFIPSPLSSFIPRLYDVYTSQSLLGRYISLVPFLQPEGCPPHRPPVAFLGCHIQDIHTTPTGSQLLLLLSLSLFPSL